MPPRINTLTVIASSVALAAGVYTAATYRRISSVRSAAITTTHSIPPTFQASKAFNLANPKSFAFSPDSRSITLRVPSKKLASHSDEVLLARALRGFFGGWVFTPERIALGILNLKPGNFPGLTTPAKRIWDTASLQTDTLPPVSTTLFGIFQIADYSIASDDKGAESTVDVVFGSPDSRFSGCHRLSVSRQLEADDTANVTVTLSCIAGNPSEDKPTAADYLLGFHRLYAKLLFRDSVAEIQQYFNE